MIKILFVCHEISQKSDGRFVMNLVNKRAWQIN